MPMSKVVVSVCAAALVAAAQAELRYAPYFVPSNLERCTDRFLGPSHALNRCYDSEFDIDGPGGGQDPTVDSQLVFVKEDEPLVAFIANFPEGGCQGTNLTGFAEILPNPQAEQPGACRTCAWGEGESRIWCAEGNLSLAELADVLEVTLDDFVANATTQGRSKLAMYETPEEDLVPATWLDDGSGGDGPFDCDDEDRETTHAWFKDADAIMPIGQCLGLKEVATEPMDNRVAIRRNSVDSVAFYADENCAELESEHSLPACLQLGFWTGMPTYVRFGVPRPSTGAMGPRTSVVMAMMAAMTTFLSK